MSSPSKPMNLLRYFYTLCQMGLASIANFHGFGYIFPQLEMCLKR